MSTAIQRRKGTTAEHSTFAGLNGELTVDTTKKTVVVHDGRPLAVSRWQKNLGLLSALLTSTAAQSTAQ